MKFSISLIVCLFFSAVFNLKSQSFSYNSPICKNQPNQAPITSPGFPTGGTYSGGSGLSINASSGVINLALSTPGIYTVAYTSTAAPMSATIEIFPSPQPVTVTGNTVCSNQSSSSFTLVASSADPFMSYYWLPSGSPGSTFVAPSGPGTYTVVGSTVNGCTTQAVVTASAIAAAQPSIAGPAIICEGTAVTLTASGSTSYTWSTGAQSAVMSDTPPVVGVYVYTVTGTDPLGCEGQKQHTVSVYPNPTVTIVNGQPTLCAGYSLALSAGGAQTYSWSSGHTTQNIIVVPTSSVTTYTVVGTSNTCTNFAVHTVVWVPLPAVTIVGSNSLCAGNSLTLIATSSNGVYNYTWSPSGFMGDTLVVTPFTSTTYSAFANNAGCPGSDGHHVSVAPRPNVTVLPATHTLCSGIGGALKTAIGAVTFTWSTGVVSNTIFLTPPRDSTYYVVGTNSSGCKDTTYFFIKVNPTPTVTVNSPSICSGETATLEAISDPSEGVQFQWAPISWVTATFNPAPMITTTYTVKVTAPGPCTGSAVATVSVVKTVKANVSFKYDGPYCNGNYSAVPIPSASFTPGGSYFNPSAELPVIESTGVVALNNVQEGFYLVNYSVATKGCTLENTGSASFLVNKSIHLTGPELIEIYPGNEVELKHSGGAEKYQWYPPVDLSCTNCEYPVATPLVSTNYCVKSPQPCVFGTCIMVDVICMNYGDLSVPNAFTPNNDGKNDKFCLQGWKDCNIDFYIAIYDRWGTKVYESVDPSFCWDGNFNGTPLPSAVYMYQIVAQFKKERAIKKSGNISIIK